MEQRLILDTPIGSLTLTASDEAVTSIRFGQHDHDSPSAATTKAATTATGAMSASVSGSAAQTTRWTTTQTTPGAAAQTTPLLEQAARELQEYFAGKRHDFTFPMKPAGTPFQLAVWEVLRTIPCGQTRTYKQIAEQVGRPAACRAVGMANNRNPLPVVIPCHRVVGSDGRMVGYAGGLDVKQRLLDLEKENK